MKYNFYNIKLILILIFIFLFYNILINKLNIINETYYNSFFTNISPSPTDFNINGLSPNILKIEKSGNIVTLYLKKNIRDTDLFNPKEISVYEIYFKRKDQLDLKCNVPSMSSEVSTYSPGPSITPISSISPVPSFDFNTTAPDLSYDNTFLYEKRKINLNDWNRLVVDCKTDKICKIKIDDLYFDTGEDYLFFAIKNNNGIKSAISNIVTVSNKKQFSIYEENLFPSSSENFLKKEKNCETFSFKDCPTELNGTILSRCYRDKLNKKCKTLLFDDTVFKI